MLFRAKIPKVTVLLYNMFLQIQRHRHVLLHAIMFEQILKIWQLKRHTLYVFVMFFFEREGGGYKKLNICVTIRHYLRQMALKKIPYLIKCRCFETCLDPNPRCQDAMKIQRK